MKLLVVSDLHIEINGLVHRNWAPADGLIIAGDLVAAIALQKKFTDSRCRGIKKSVDFLKENIFPQYKFVLYVMGNHEHYSGYYENTKEILETYIDNKNVKILERESFQYDDHVFLGTTLWTDFDKNNPISINSAKFGMNDYRVIFNKDNLPIHPDFTYSEHNLSINWLKNQIQENKNKQIIVITHHCPSLKSLNQYHAGNELDYAYASELEYMMGDNIKMWVHGHTHMNFDYNINGTRVFSNQCGYSGEYSFKLFETDKIIEV